MINVLRRKTILVFISFTFMLFFSYSFAYAASSIEKKILIINPYTQDYPGNDLFSQGVKNVLQENSEYNFKYSYEYLDLAHHAHEEDYIENTAKYLKFKYLKQQPDFIITKNQAYSILLKSGNDMFPNVPIIIDWSEDQQPLTKLPSNYVAICRSIEIDKNIQLILQTSPLTKKIYLVIGDSPSEQNVVKRIIELQSKYVGKVEFVLLNKLPYEQMLDKIRSASKDSAILYFQWFSDVNGNGFIPADVIKTICKEAKVPVYGTATQYLGSGIIGGNIGNQENIGQIAGEEILNILSGEKIADNPVIQAPNRLYSFDWRQLKKWGIDENKLPEGSTIKYKESSVWELYGRYIAGAIVILIMQTMLILSLLINRSKRRKVECELVEKNSSLQAMSEKLISLDKLKDEFLANTSHELRTPLNGIINITQAILEDNKGSLTKKERKNMEIVKASGHRLYNLVNDILDFSRLKEGEIKLDLKPVNLNMIVSLVIYVFEFLLKDKDIVILNEVPEVLTAVIADEERLKQIFYNLIGNAVKFTEHGSIVVSAEVKNGWVQISVQDTGIGIQPEKLSNIFQAFIQVHGDASRAYEGTGLGLTITQKLVELHEGKLWVNSELQKGSTFTFTLPATEEVVQEEMYLKVVQPNPVLNSTYDLSDIEIEGNNGFSILVVDDDYANLRAITNFLAVENYSIKAVTKGQAVLDLFESGCKFDLLILDLMMPGTSGFEVLKTLRKSYSYVDLPVLILTARTLSEDIEIVFTLGANDFLKKPFEARELCARVKTLVQLRNLVRHKVSSEIMFLQAQIRPHFIFNAFNVIASLATKDAEKTRELVLDLSDYLRGSFDFDGSDGLTTLKKELELVRAYLSIEQARFKQRLQVEFNIEGNLDCTIPMLSIQPLVENAIKHGIMPLIEGGKVVVSVREQGNFVKVLVSDNGIGMDREKIVALLSGEVKTGSVGLKNIHRRLMTLYGRGIEIVGKKERGTTVEFEIPYKEKGMNQG